MSENFVTGGEGFVCWILENVINSGLNESKVPSEHENLSYYILLMTAGGYFYSDPSQLCQC